MAERKTLVEYNWLSENCGLKVSNICLGSVTFGRPIERYQIPGNADKKTSIELLNRFAELGGNFVDTSNNYCNGESEEIVGSWLSSRDRESIVVATKVFGDSDALDVSHPNQIGLSRGSIMYNVDESLRRLRTGYVDLYYMHCWDQGVKIEETLRAFDDLVRSGKVRYVGLSNFTGGMLQKVMDYSHFMGFTPCVTLQQQYNLGNRESDIEVVPACLRERISLLPYSPLKGGLLSGKFQRDAGNTAASLTGTRLGWTAERPGERTHPTAPNIEALRNDENYWLLMDAIEDIGKQQGKTPAQVSIRWLLQKDFIPSVIIGAKSIEQLEENMGAGTGWKLTDEQMKTLDEASRVDCPIPVYPYQIIDRWNNKLKRCRQN